MSAAPSWLRQYLFRQDGMHAYVVLDGASVPDLPARLWELEPEHICLYRGELEPDVAEVAPYLVELVDGSPFTQWLMASAWGEHWGTFLRAAGGLRMCRDHFRRLLMVRTEDSRFLYFAFYDPRVLRVFLPLCDQEQLEEMFGPVAEYLAEGEDPGEGKLFGFTAGKLVSTTMGEATVAPESAPTPTA
ncbi:MAG TPA: DUF4123 domain-containing protein [Candidatus Binatia bacterium]|nr:DUF4123 domain-containing protein [Candidatus Binatia bacterium]